MKWNDIIVGDKNNKPDGIDDITLHEKLPWEDWRVAVKAYVKVFMDWEAYVNKKKKQLTYKGGGPKFDNLVSIFKSKFDAKPRYDKSRYMKHWSNDKEKKQYEIMCGFVENRRKERIAQVMKDLKKSNAKYLTLQKLSEKQIDEHDWLGWSRSTRPHTKPLFTNSQQKRKSNRNKDDKKEEVQIEVEEEEEDDDIDINVETGNEQADQERKYNEMDTDNKYEDNDPEVQILQVKMERKEIDLSHEQEQQPQQQIQEQQPQQQIQEQETQSPITSPTQTYQGSEYEQESYDCTVHGLEPSLQTRINELSDANIQFYAHTQLNSRDRDIQFDSLFIDMIEKVSKAYVSIGIGIHGHGVPQFETEKALNIIRCWIRLRKENCAILDYMEIWMELHESYSACLSKPTFCDNEQSQKAFVRAIAVKKASLMAPLRQKLVQKQQELKEYIKKRKETQEVAPGQEERMVLIEIERLKKRLEPYRKIMEYYETTIKSSLPYIWENQNFDHRYGMALFMVLGYPQVAGAICVSFLLNTCLNNWAAQTDGVWKQIVGYFCKGLKMIKNILYGEVLLIRKMAQIEKKSNTLINATENYINQIYDIWHRLSQVNSVYDPTTLDLVIQILGHVKEIADGEQIKNNIKNILSNKRKVFELKKIYLETFNKHWIILNFFSEHVEMDKMRDQIHKIKHFTISDIAVSTENLINIISEPLKLARPQETGEMDQFGGIETVDLEQEMENEEFKCM